MPLRDVFFFDCCCRCVTLTVNCLNQFVLCDLWAPWELPKTGLWREGLETEALQEPKIVLQESIVTLSSPARPRGPSRCAPLWPERTQSEEATVCYQIYTFDGAPYWTGGVHDYNIPTMNNCALYRTMLRWVWQRNRRAAEALILKQNISWLALLPHTTM